jgi:3-oxoadipate enol-lactonase
VSDRAREPSRFEVRADGVTLVGELSGEGAPIVLLHGLSATRRGVVHGSRYLVRQGYRLIAYDARGHGESSPPPDPRAYAYRDLVGDLEAVLDHLGLDRPALVGSSMGAATAMAWALEHPDRAAALVQITPASLGPGGTDGVPEAQWQRFADALERGGIERFVEIAQPEDVPERWRELAREATRQRLERHAHLQAIPNALRVVPRSDAFAGLEPLEHLEVPVLVVGSRDEADRIHPLAVAEEYARRLPRSELLVEDEDESPIAWRGARLSRAIADFLKRVGYPPRP